MAWDTVDRLLQPIPEFQSKDMGMLQAKDIKRNPYKPNHMDASHRITTTDHLLPDFDDQMEINDIIKQILGDIKISHVKGHQNNT